MGLVRKKAGEWENGNSVRLSATFYELILQKYIIFLGSRSV